MVSVGACVRSRPSASYLTGSVSSVGITLSFTEGERLEKGMRKIEAKLHHSRLCHAEAATAVGGA